MHQDTVPTDHRLLLRLPIPPLRRIGLLCLAFVAVGLSACDEPREASTATGSGEATIAYPADDGPGEIGDRILSSDLGVVSSDPAAVAIKVGRRTYRAADEGGVTVFVLPPERYSTADRAAAATVAERTTTVSSCDGVGDAFATAVISSLAGVTNAALDTLPVEDRHYAATEPLLVPIERTRVDAAALGCDLTQIATTTLDRLDPEVRSVLQRSLTPLDASSGTAEEREASVSAADIGQLLAPVTR